MSSSNVQHRDGGETPQEQLDQVWSVLRSHQHRSSSGCPREWPSYDTVLGDMARADYSETLKCPHDMRNFSSSNNKSLCPFGVAVCAKMELFSQPDASSHSPSYTGLLTPGHTLEHCIVRLSSAIKPPDSEVKSRLGRTLLHATGANLKHAKLFPTVAIKAFRGNGVRSGNLLFGGCKVGQREDDFFAHCVCTQMTERMPRPLRPLVRKFRTYSKHPLSLGVSDFCAFDVDGDPAKSPNFPFCIILSPCRTRHGAGTNDTAPSHENAFDKFLDDALAIPSGTVLYDVFCCPSPEAVPDPRQLQRIGRIITTSEMLPSSPQDGLFFRHQRKEEDYELRPAWKHRLKTKCVLADGTHGTADSLAGWELFEGHIQKGRYVDFEKLAVANT